VTVSSEATCYTTAAPVGVCDTTVVGGKKKKRDAGFIESAPKPDPEHQESILSFSAENFSALNFGQSSIQKQQKKF
jgi:hypothetical protein